MSTLQLDGIGVADLLAPLWFVLSWVGCTLQADRMQGGRDPTRTMHRNRCIQPWLFILLSAWVAVVLYRCEFRSRLLRTLGVPDEPPLG